MISVAVVFVALVQFGLVFGACNPWDGVTPITSGTVINIYSSAISSWLTYSALPIGTNPQGLRFSNVAADFTLNNVGPFSYGGTGIQGSLFSPNGLWFNNAYGGNYFTASGSGPWNFAIVPQPTAPNVHIWKSQNNANWGYRMGLQNINGVTALQNNQANYEFQLYICSSTPAPTLPPTPPPTVPPTPPPTSAPTCSVWSGAAIVSGTVLQLYSPAANLWVNYGALPIGTNPQGLKLQATAASFTLNNVGAFSYGGAGVQGALTSPNGLVFNDGYGGNYVTASPSGPWNFAIVQNGAAPNVRVWKSQNNAFWGYLLGLQAVNGQVLLQVNQPNTDFVLYICA